MVYAGLVGRIDSIGPVDIIEHSLAFASAALIHDGLLNLIGFGFKIISIEKGLAVGCPRRGTNSLFSKCRKCPKIHRLEKLGGKVKFLFLSRPRYYLVRLSCGLRVGLECWCLVLRYLGLVVGKTPLSLSCWNHTTVSVITEAYCFTASLFHVSIVRERMWWWISLARKKLWWWIASSGLPYQNDAIRFQENVQNDSCLSRLLLMTECFVLREYEKSLHIISLVTKHFVMRECENIRSGYLCVLTAVFSQMMTIYCHIAQCARSKGFPLV